ncbi:MAG: hypothetical protein IJC81_01625 [Clostridia bacterium]|nr:hypothetical protein [Clostridia bacterium]
MKIALPFENSNIYTLYEQATSFKIYEIENGKIVTMRFVPIPSMDVSAFADMKIDVMLCEAITDSVKQSICDIGIRVCDGYSGNADVAVRDFLNNK